MRDLGICISRLRLSYGLVSFNIPCLPDTLPGVFETCSRLSIISGCPQIADFFIGCVQ